MVEEKQLLWQGKLRKRAMTLAIVLLHLSAPRLVPGQESLEASETRIEATGLLPASLRPFDTLMRSFMRDHRVPGAAIAVARNGRLVFARGYGNAGTSVTEQKTVQPSSLFRIASVSKPITAAVILQLIEQKKLRLEMPIIDVLEIEPSPKLRMQTDRRWKSITIGHLLYHTAGFDRSVSFDPMFRSVHIKKALGMKGLAEARDVAQYMLSQDLDFDPGARYAYSNFGYALLGLAIEATTGMKYEEYCRKNVFQRFGDSSSRIGRTQESAADEVHYHSHYEAVDSIFDGKPRSIPYGAWYLEAMAAHGGWISSAPSLVRFALEFDDESSDDVLSLASRQLAFQRPAPAYLMRQGDSAAYYACGWLVRPKKSGSNTWHNGALDGTSTLLVRRHDGLTWCVLFNARHALGNKATFASMIDPLMHKAANQVESWPNTDLFAKFGLAPAKRTKPSNSEAPKNRGDL